MQQHAQPQTSGEAPGGGAVGVWHIAQIRCVTSSCEAVMTKAESATGTKSSAIDRDSEVDGGSDVSWNQAPVSMKSISPRLHKTSKRPSGIVPPNCGAWPSDTFCQAAGSEFGRRFQTFWPLT